MSTPTNTNADSAFETHAVTVANLGVRFRDQKKLIGKHRRSLKKAKRGSTGAIALARAMKLGAANLRLIEQQYRETLRAVPRAERSRLKAEFSKTSRKNQ